MAANLINRQTETGDFGHYIIVKSVIKFFMIEADVWNLFVVL